MMKKLPIGESTFSELITPNVLYIDKTEYIYNLVKPGRARYFFSRPRRFGKSLTCSTLDAIFNDRRELFKDLWIGQSDYDWQKRPVLFFDFNQISHKTPEILVKGIHSALNNNAKQYNIVLEENDIKEKFTELVLKVSQKYGSVVIIIDEYDKPIIDLIEQPELADLSRAELKEFYSTLKSKDVDANMHFLFITGVSKFAKVALFSDLNNLHDLTNIEQVAALVGYTDQEVDKYLSEHIQAFADKLQEPFEKTQQTLKSWYNGYRFSSANITVYNPFSLHNCLTNKLLSNYWFSSGTPNFLMKFIQKNPVIASDIETVEGSFFAASDLESFTLDMYYQNYRTLLLQTGYLTFISGYDAGQRGYIIGYPNEEIRYSMTEQIMRFVGDITSDQFGKFGNRFREALAVDDLYLFCKHLQDFIKLVPHNIRVAREKFYQQIFFMVCILFGKRKATEVEVATEEGFMDLLLEGNKCTFVIEFKRNDTVDVALEQIERKRYWERFEILKTKKIVLGGITFNETKTGIEVKCKTKEL